MSEEHRQAEQEEPPESILIIEDSAVARAHLSDLLEGYRLRMATDGPSGLAAAAEEPPDLILLDIHLPGMDGYDVCRRLKGEEGTRDIPVLFITSLGSGEERVQGFQAGGEDYIVKPFFPSELLARVRVHLELRRAKRQAIELEKLNILREMAVALSHQINNPLTAVFGCMYILEKETAEQEMLPEVAKQSLEGMR
ncbi:MAG TPA: response regulator, partial [Verrucomicrobiae bacterium]|nr:response regulator [Verrucomicrobiae bacterium]